jgi:hydrogenase maturation factor HypF (carbamoyltransferase family)
MTSGNISEEPIIHDNEESFLKLSDLADAFLVHNRDIFMKIDDSVIKVSDHDSASSSQNPLLMKYAPDPRVFFIRRSRGYVPEPVPLLEDGPDVLGCGADLKNTFTITKGSYAIPSQHIGDMEIMKRSGSRRDFGEFEICLPCNLKLLRMTSIPLYIHPIGFNTGARMNGRTLKPLVFSIIMRTLDR